MIKQDWRKALPEDFPDTSRVWIYQNNRPFTQEEESEIGRSLQQFVDSWVSHNRPVKGWARVLFGHFILMMADDTTDRICGSAVDNSVRFIKDLELQHDLKLLNRMNMGFVEENKFLVISMNEVEQHVSKGRLHADSLFFNNTVTTKGELLQQWLIPFKESFLWKTVSSSYR